MESPGGEAVKAPRGAILWRPRRPNLPPGARVGSSVPRDAGMNVGLMVKRLDSWCARQSNWKRALLAVGLSLLFWLLMRALLTWLRSPLQLPPSAG
jgi:hypothetical protein